MTDLEEALKMIDAVPGLSHRLDGMVTGAFYARGSLMDEDAKLVPGPDDLLARVIAFEEVERGVWPMRKGERVPVGVSSDLLIETIPEERFSTFCYGGAYRAIKEALNEELPRLTESQRLAVLMKYVPHTIRLVTVVWYKDFVLMRLKNAGTAVKPASVIQFPQRIAMARGTSLHEASEKLAKSPWSPFIKPYWDVETAPSWTYLTLDRPEIVLVRHAEFKGDPSRFYGTWAEEQYHPNVWLYAGAVTDAAEGNATELIRGVRIADKQYRAKGRNFSINKIPLQSSLVVKDTLKLDDVSCEVASVLTASILRCAI